MYALFLNERYNATNSSPRFERAYSAGGRYCDPTLWVQYGRAAACSYSNWQIMFPVAVELGYRGTPEALDEDATAIVWVVQLLRKRLVKFARQEDGRATLSELLDAYNSGNPRDANVPHEYIARGAEHYADAFERLLSTTTEV